MENGALHINGTEEVPRALQKCHKGEGVSCS